MRSLITFNRTVRRLAALAVMSTVATSAWAQSTTAEAFSAGRTFAASGSTAAGAQANASTGSAMVPHYTTTAPESANYGGGKGNLWSAGAQKQVDCQGAKASSSYAQQECDAVNFLSKNPQQRQKYPVDKNADPLLSASKNIIANPGSIPGGSTQQCRVENVTTPGTFVEETCTQTNTYDTYKCDRTITTTCAGATATLVCPSGQSLSGGICTGSVTTTSNANLSYTCSGGASLSGTDCITITSTYANQTLYCIPPAVQVGNNCATTTTTGVSTGTRCPGGAWFNGSSCTRNGDTFYFCDSTLDGSPLIGWAIDNNMGNWICYYAAQNYSYCAAGYSLVNGSCVTTTTAPAQVSYSCPDGSTLSGSNCLSTSTTPATPVYSCLPGGVLNGTTCTYVVTVTSSAETQYSCGSGVLTAGPVQSGNPTYLCCTDSLANGCVTLEAQSQ